MPDSMHINVVRRNNMTGLKLRHALAEHKLARAHARRLWLHFAFVRAVALCAVASEFVVFGVIAPVYALKNWLGDGSLTVTFGVLAGAAWFLFLAQLILYWHLFNSWEVRYSRACQHWREENEIHSDTIKALKSRLSHLETGIVRHP